MNIGGATRGFLQLISANLLTKITGILALVLFTRQLSIEELAFLPVYQMPGALSYVILGFGLQPTMIRRLPALLKTDRPQAGSLIRMGTSIIMTGTAVFAIGVFFAAAPIAKQLLGSSDHFMLIRITAFGSLSYTWRNIFHHLLWAASRFDKMAAVRTGAALGRTIFGVAGLFIGGIEGLAIGFVINDTLALILAIVYCRDLLRIPAGPRVPIKGLLNEARPFHLESFMTYLRGQGDNWVVATALGPESLGIYFVAKRFPMLLTMFLDSLDKIVTTKLSQKRNDPQAIRTSINSLLSPMATLAVPSIFMVMALLPTLTRLVAGPGFEAAILPGIVLCIMQLGRLFVVPIGRGVFLTRPPLTRMLVTTVESIFLIVSLILLMPILAELGVAISRVIAALTTLICSYWVLKRHLAIKFPWRRIIISFFTSSSMLAVILFGVMTNHSLTMAPIFIAGGITVFVILTWLFQASVFLGDLEKAVPFPLPNFLQRRIHQEK